MRNIAPSASDNGESLVVDFHTSSVLGKYPAKQHALRVVEQLDVKEGLIYLPGAVKALLEDSDMPVPFRQRRYFFYLSGVNEADCHLTYDIQQDELILWLPPIDPVRVVWVGRGSTVEEACDKYDIDESHYSRDLSKYIEEWIKSNPGKMYLLHASQSARPSNVHLLDKKRVDFGKLPRAMDYCRARKDPHEVGLIRKACNISSAAHTAVLRNLLHYTNEAQVEACFLEHCVAEDAKNQAYEIIAGSGSNGAILHYVKNDEDFGDSQFMVLDAGCEWDCYASDITRTIPLSGRWPSEEAKQIYDLVQTMQSSCITALRPGRRFLDLYFVAHSIAIQGLLKLGILHNGTFAEIWKAGTSRAFFPHGLGHHMGLEVHDVSERPITAARQNAGMAVPRPGFSGAKLERMSTTSDAGLAMIDMDDLTEIEQFDLTPELCLAPCDSESNLLEEGMVVTVEPGIYFNRFALEQLYLCNPTHSKYIDREMLERYMPVGGVRIEDDVLITRDHFEILTTAPKGEQALKIIRGEEPCREGVTLL
ncbi:hypothetical protein LTR50_002904 [Elasticomyces elasticus]|nr:hypothetical protein LTR50_002904 [Elasticomyces elasticus]